MYQKKIVFNALKILGMYALFCENKYFVHIILSLHYTE